MWWVAIAFYVQNTWTKYVMTCYEGHVNMTAKAKHYIHFKQGHCSRTTVAFFKGIPLPLMGARKQEEKMGRSIKAFENISGELHISWGTTTVQLYQIRE